MKSNKLILSMVISSIAAVSFAPDVLSKDFDGKNTDNDYLNNADNKIDLSDIKSFEASLDGTEKEFYESISAQVDEQLNKKTAIIEISQNIDSILDGYKNESLNLKDEMLKEIFTDEDLAQYNYTQNRDSTALGTFSGSASTIVGCHAACHGACHYACYGSRGWR